jgi:hypothetical protein
MRMPSVQFTVRGMMVAVAVVAFDFFVLMMTDGAGVMLIGLLLNVGFVRWWRTQGRRHPSWGGFVAAGLAAVLAYIGCIQMFESGFLQWPLFIINSTLPYLPLGAEQWVIDHLTTSSQLIAFMMFEVSFGLPMLLFALVGGLLSASTWPRRIPRADTVLSGASPDA